jgi:hypothetical protein
MLKKSQTARRGLKGSGEIEATADLILFGQWPYKVDASIPKHHYLAWAVKCRNRDIASPQMGFTFDPSKQTFN